MSICGFGTAKKKKDPRHLLGGPSSDGKYLPARRIFACVCAVACLRVRLHSKNLGGGEEERKRGELFLRVTQHSPAVQVAAVHVFVAGLAINTLDAAAHPAKPIHFAADSAEKDGNVNKKAQLRKKQSQSMLPMEPNK